MTSLVVHFCSAPLVCFVDALDTALAELRSETVTALFVTSTMWDVADDRFDLAADVSDVLREHGPGVYTAQVWARVKGEMEAISRYAIFHEVEVPEGYAGH